MSPWWAATHGCIQLVSNKSCRQAFNTSFDYISTLLVGPVSAQSKPQAGIDRAAHLPHIQPGTWKCCCTTRGKGYQYQRVSNISLPPDIAQQPRWSCAAKMVQAKNFFGGGGMGGRSCGNQSSSTYYLSLPSSFFQPLL